MKRKRGSAKRKPKKPSEAANVNVDPGYYSDVNENNDGLDSRVEKANEVNTSTSGQHVGLEKPAVNYETAGSAAAKLARAISISHASAMTDRVPLQRETIGTKEPKSSGRAPIPIYNKQELDAAQSVIKKIMKMDGAGPFNVPVDPIALNIPDYFDIIDTPMDFGTICSNLEKGLEYRNSEDVFKDVQRIWDNCCKYNKIGSYIVNLMNRVKNNFIKQWTAAGLYNEQTVSNGHLPNNPQFFAEPVMRHEEPMHMYPVGPTSSSAYLQHHDLARLDPRQHHQFSPYYSHTFRPQPLSYQPPYYSLHPGQSPGQHPHDLAPQYNHNSHMHSVDLMNGNSHNPWVNEANPGLMHSYQPSPGFSLIGHPQEKIYLHQPSSSQLPPSRLQDGIIAQGHVHLPHGESPSAFNKHRAVNSGRSAGDGSHHQHHQMDSVPTQTYHPSSSCMPAHKLNQTTSRHLQSSHIQGGRNIDYTENLPVLPPTESAPNYAKRGTGSLRHPLTDNTSCQQPHQINSSPEQSSSTDNIETCHPLEKTCQNQLGSSPSERLYSTADNKFSKKKDQGKGFTEYQEKSIVNYAKCGTGSLRNPLTDNTSCQQPNQINSSPEQSSSTDNIETCHPLEKTCQNQLGSSPSERLYSTADNNFSKKKDQGKGFTEYQEKSTVNYAKCGTVSLRNPLTDNTSCQQPYQINSSHEQSSSTNNIETCHPLDNTCQNQQGSSPSKRLYSTADSNISKKKDRGQGLTQNQKKSLSVMNKQIQNKISSLKSLSPPLYLDYTTKFKRKQGRGPTRSPVLREGERIPVAINEQGQPVGHTAQKLVNYLGTLARNGEFLPLTYLNWRAVPLENKEDMWQKIQSKFEIDPISKDWLLQSIGLKWKSWKANLKNVHYYPHETDAERLADRDERVPPDQWADLIAFWNTETAKKLSATNRANRMNQKFYHASGNKSFARIREEQKSAGKDLSRAELFIVTRTRKNGEPINTASAEVIKQLREREKGHDDTPQKSSKEGDILTEIMGPNKKGSARCIELGPSSSDLLKPSRGEAIKMVAQAKVEMREMKDKMSVMEQTCAQMASQMATMMSMMSSMHSRNSPDKNAPHMDANPAALSEHSIPQQVHTRPPSSFTGSTRMTRSKREF